MRIRPQTPEELHAVLDVVARAFVAEPPVVGLTRELEADESFIPEFSIVAEDAGALVGQALLTRAWIGGSGPDARPALLIAPLGVVPERQRSGVGSALVREALDRARAAGESVVFVFGDPAYYGRFGFESAYARRFEPPHPIVEHADAWQVIGLRPGAFEECAGVVRFGEPLNDPQWYQAESTS